ncbi:GNAT family N-acetyltransferase [Lampropedia aestuarii]|uniref:GNAT family N-acetyltransferase n=1 Tax=Lampropedia aestuarii TaxID=2562762 RepID=A0A4S5BQV8_9BURK|nr:GNAT family N-acetyltransferase [Lampropedia aestuarii]MDH5858873.1 GNAT family N-acetyltransferase [Lampropedia aestuarii]THJ35167.1 GNAT family N-acetyltransferase [Lampropedia aestuarii]
MTLFITPSTERLQLRQWRDSDRSPFAALNADPQVMEFFPEPLSRSQSDAIADRCESLIEQNGWGFWAVELKSTGQFIGFVGLHRPIDALPFAPCVEIGWRLAPAFWGRGLATEAAHACLQTGFSTLGLTEIVAFTAEPNLRSRAVMERLGMQADGLFEHPSLAPGHALRTHCLYRLARSAYQPHGGSAMPMASNN